MKDLNEKFEPADYESLAPEYYDKARHPTCSDFRAASIELISRYLEFASLKDALSPLEIGAGRSVFVDLSDKYQDLATRAVATDRSMGMLRYTDRNASGPKLICASANALPFPKEQFDLVVASLGDPYNDESFWQEIERILVPGGCCIFTTPALGWSSRYRSAQQNDSQAVAVFETSDGKHVAVPSFVLPISEQIALIDRGGLITTDVWTFTRGMFRDGPTSSKIRNYSTSSTPIVSQFVARKADERPWRAH